MNLERKINLQVNLAIIQFISIAIVFVGFFISFGGHGTIGTIISIIGAAPFIATWIFGIINAIRIDKVTEHNTTPLIVFAVIPLFFVHWIVAAHEKKRYASVSIDEGHVEGSVNAEIEKELLKEEMIKGTITPEAFENKTQELNVDMDKKPEEKHGHTPDISV